MNSPSSQLDLTAEDLSLRWLFTNQGIREEINNISITCYADRSLGASFPLLAERGRRLVAASNMSLPMFINKVMSLPRLPSPSVQPSPTNSDSSDLQTPSPRSDTTRTTVGVPLQFSSPNHKFLPPGFSNPSTPNKSTSRPSDISNSKEMQRVHFSNDLVSTKEYQILDVNDDDLVIDVG